MSESQPAFVLPRLDLFMARSLRTSWEQAKEANAKAVYERTAIGWISAGDAGTLVLEPGAAAELEMILRS